MPTLESSNSSHRYIYIQCLGWPKIMYRVFEGATAQSRQWRLETLIVVRWYWFIRWSATHATLTDCTLSASIHPKFSAVQFSHSVVSSSLQPHGLQHTRPPCPSPTPRACPNSCPSSQWCHPTLSPSVVPFSSSLQSSPASGSFPMSQFFASGGQSIGASASAPVLSMNIQDWFPLGLTGLISLQSKGLPRVFSNTTVQNHQFFCVQLSL